MLASTIQFSNNNQPHPQPTTADQEWPGTKKTPTNRCSLRTPTARPTTHTNQNRPAHDELILLTFQPKHTPPTPKRHEQDMKKQTP